MPRYALSAAFAAASLSLAHAPAYANEFEGALRALASEELSAWATDPAIVAAVRAQNAAHAGLAQAEIEAMDQTWRAEIGAGASPTIDAVMARPESGMLRDRKEQVAGLVTEVFVMDNRGLNVAQSDVTSDYWQGDEPKWQDSFGKGAGSMHISDVELDESTQSYQSQVSLPVTDPESGEAIGAVTFGINLEMLQ